MPKPHNKKNLDDSNQSIVAEFVTHQVLGEKEIEKYEEEVIKEAKEAEIDESLSEIYQDEKGEMIDVRRLSIKKYRWFSRLFSFIFVFGLMASAGYVGYNYIFLGKSTDPSAVEFKLEGEEEILAGEEFFYTINYKNTGRIALKDAVINLQYPSNYTLLDTVENKAKGTWYFPEIAPGYSGLIKIKGKIIAHQDTSGIALANFTYKPANFNSEFKKESSFVTLVKSVGLKIEHEYPSPVLAGADADFTIILKPENKNFIHNFRLSISPLENLEFFALADIYKNIQTLRPGVYDINLLSDKENIFVLPFKFTKKINDTEEITLQLSQDDENNLNREFYQEKILIDVIKSDLNLTMVVNGSKVDNGIDFGKKLNYSIIYTNKGEVDLRNIILMAVINSDFVDWKSLKDDNNGVINNNNIVWSKKEIPELELLSPKEEGTIDFSLDVSNPEQISLEGKYFINAYAQYSIGSSTESADMKSDDFRSNKITTSINSDLSLQETLRYFNEDNIAVGSGPLPPKVSETTILKVFWNIKNTLHELKELQVIAKLPDYVSYDNNQILSAGELSYNPDDNSITWNIGPLPVTVEALDAQFNIKLIPRPEDKGKILVILTGTAITAIDEITGENINKETNTKTTKLEDDDIANIDGVIQ
jgi:hypothetical protein